MAERLTCRTPPGSGCPWFMPRPSRCFLSHGTLLLCLSLPRYIKRYRGRTAGGGGGVTLRPGGNSNTPTHALCYGNRYKLKPFGYLSRIPLYFT